MSAQRGFATALPTTYIRRGVLAAFLCAVVACRAERPEAESERQGSRTTVAAARVVSLIPSATEVIVALGAADRLVARTEYDRQAALASLPSVGGGLTPSLEQLTLLRPDLVIAWPDNPSRSLSARLTELQIATYTTQIQTLADLRRIIRDLGVLLSLPAAADSLISEIDAELAGIHRAVSDLPRRSVFYVVWYDPPSTAGPGTYIDELIDLAGGRNVFADAPALWPQVSLEEIVRRQPDIIVLAQTEDRPFPLERLASAPGWRELAAVRDGRVVRVDADLFNRPGPHVGAAAHELAAILHPSALERLPRRW